MPLKTLRDDTPSLNLTPLIDVLFLLIIFFMAGSSFSEWERDLSVRLPSVSNSQLPPSPKPHHIISLDPAGSIALDKEPVTMSELLDRLKKLREGSDDVTVSIRGDAQCPLQIVASVLGTCRQAGIEHTGITVRPAAVASHGEKHLR